ncbi:predicted protein, partial [Nematostella vectensis]
GNITIGALLPFHVKNDQDGCGEFYAFGVGYYEAFTLAIERINNDTALLPNITLGVDIWDYCDLPAIAVKEAHGIAMNNYLNEIGAVKGGTGDKSFDVTAPVVAVIGTEDSSSTSLVSSLLQVVNITTISPFATSEELSMPYYSKFFRTIPPDGQQAKAMVDIIEHFGWKYVAAVAVDHSYGRYGVRALEKEAYNRGSFCIAFVDYFTRSGELIGQNRSSYMGKITSIIQKLKRETNIRVIVFWSSYEPAKRFLEEASAQGMTGRTFLMSEAMATIAQDLLQRHVDVLNGSIGLMPHRYRDHVYEAHLRMLSAADTRGNPWWDEFWASEFGCDNSQSKSSNRCRDSLEVSQSGFNRLYNSYNPYLADAVYAIAHALDDARNCTRDCTKSPDVSPGDVAKYLRQVSFKGFTGHVYFSDQGNPADSFYDVVHFRSSETTGPFSVQIVGSWRQSDLKPALFSVNQSRMRWNNERNQIPASVCSETCQAGFRQTKTVACCWECLPCQTGYINSVPGSLNCTKCPFRQMSNLGNTECVDLPVVNISWTDTTSVLFLIFTAIGMVATIFTFAVFIIHQDTPVVKASNRELSYLLLLLIALSFVLTVLHLAIPTTALCYAVQPYRYLTCTASVSILLLKTNRLVRAFQTNVIPPWFKKYVLDRKRQLYVVFLLNSIQIILTGLWIGLDPPYMSEDIHPQEYVFLACLPFKTKTGNALRTIMFVYFIFLSLVSSVYAFKARRLPDNFNEARFIGFSMYVMLLSWIAYYPVDSALEGYYITIVACATALVIAYGLLLCLFAPKLFVILRRPQQN